MSYEVRVPESLLLAPLPAWVKIVWMSMRSYQGEREACFASFAKIGSRAIRDTGKPMDKGQVSLAIAQLELAGFIKKTGRRTYVCLTPGIPSPAGQHGAPSDRDNNSTNVDHPSTFSVKNNGSNVDHPSTPDGVHNGSNVDHPSTTVDHPSTRSYKPTTKGLRIYYDDNARIGEKDVDPDQIPVPTDVPTLPFLHDRDEKFRGAIVRALTEFSPQFAPELLQQTWRRRTTIPLQAIVDLLNTYGWEMYTAGVIIATDVDQPSLGLLESILKRLMNGHETKHKTARRGRPAHAGTSGSGRGGADRGDDPYDVLLERTRQNAEANHG